MTKKEMEAELAKSPRTSRFFRRQGAAAFPKGLPNLSGVQGNRRRVAVACCIACLILAPLSVLLFLADANATHHVGISVAMFVQVVVLFAIFGAAVWMLSTSLGKSPGQT